jgi:HEAT repeat protein
MTADKEFIIRIGAVNGLGALGDPRGMSAIVSALANPRETDEVRWAAAEAIEQLVAPYTDTPRVRVIPQVEDHIVAGLVSLLGMPGENISARQVAGRMLLRRSDRQWVPGVIAVLGEQQRLRSSYVVAFLAELLGKAGDPRAIEPLVALLTDANQALAWPKACEALRAFRGERLETALLATFVRANREGMVERLKLLGECADARAGDIVLETLKNRNPGDIDARTIAAAVAHNIPDARLTDALLEAARDANAEVRLAATLSLLDSTDPRAVAAVDAVLMGDDLEACRRLLVNVVWDIYCSNNAKGFYHPSASWAPWPVLMEAYAGTERKDTDWDARRRFGLRSTRDNDLRRRAKEGDGNLGYDPWPILSTAARHEDPAIRSVAVLGLGLRRDERGRDLIEKQWREGPESRRLDALRALAVWKDDRAWRTMAAALGGTDVEAARIAARELGWFKAEPRTVPLLESALAHPDFEVHCAAAAALSILGRPARTDEEKAWRLVANNDWSRIDVLGAAALDVMRAGLENPREGSLNPQRHYLLNEFEARLVLDLRDAAKVETAAADPDADVRRIVAAALGRGRDPASVRLLLILLNDADATVAATTAESLGYLGDAGVIPALAKRLSDGAPPRVAAAAAFALGWLHDERVVPLLLEGLTNQESDVRWAAAVVLGNLGDLRAVEPLRQAAKDAHPAVARAAQQSLDRLEGRPPPPEEPENEDERDF